MAVGADFVLSKVQGFFQPAAIVGAFATTLFAAFLVGVLRCQRAPWVRARAYRDWLAATPWEYGRPLPSGSPLPSAGDLVGLIVAGAVLAAVPRLLPLCMESNRIQGADATAGTTWLVALNWSVALWLAIAYGIGYGVVALYSVLNSGTISAGIAPAFLLPPLAVFPGQISALRIALVEAVVVAGLVYAFIEALKAFPFDAPEWKRPARELALAAALKAKRVGWPYLEVGPWRKREFQFDWKSAAMIAAIAAWWGAGVVALFRFDAPAHDKDGRLLTPAEAAKRFHDLTLCLTIALVFGGGLFRLTRYGCGGMGFLSFRARWHTRRLVVPAHDVVYLAPVCAVVATAAVVLLLDQWHTPEELLLMSGIFVGGLLLLGMGPSYEAWDLTGLNIKRSGGKRLSGTRVSASGGR